VLMILMRFLHVGSAIFWAGAVFFINTMLGPTIAALGPQGIPVMQELERRNYFGRILGAATITILSGLYLVWKDSGGFQGSWFGTHFGMGISIGMAAAVVAYVAAIVLLRPAMLRVATIGGQLAQATGGDARTALMADFDAARASLMRIGIMTMLLLVAAVIAMAVARYL
jgi:uncharacterized membrane protein